MDYYPLISAVGQQILVRVHHRFFFFTAGELAHVYPSDDDDPSTCF